MLSDSGFGLPLLAGLIAAIGALAAAAWTARRVVARARESARAIGEEARQDAESKAREILVGAQEKALALEEEADRRDRDLESREAAVETRARELEGETATLERQRRDLAADATLRRQVASDGDGAGRVAPEALGRALPRRDHALLVLSRAGRSARQPDRSAGEI